MQLCNKIVILFNSFLKLISKNLFINSLKYINPVESTYNHVKEPKESNRYIQNSLYPDDENIIYVRYQTNQIHCLESFYLEYHYIQYHNKPILL